MKFTIYLFLLIPILLNFGCDSNNKKSNSQSNKHLKTDDVKSFSKNVELDTSQLQINNLLDKEISLKFYKSSAGSNNAFNADLINNFLQSKNQINKNIFFSPYSIFSALAMTGEGARGNTLNEFFKVLYLEKNNSLRQQSMHSLFSLINSPSNKCILHSVNALWIQNGIMLNPNFLDISKNKYNASCSNLDFKMEINKSIFTINQWAEKQTNHKIKELVNKQNVQVSTKLILTNAVYFKGKWKNEFDRSDTHKNDFTNSDKTISNTDVMHITSSFKYLENDKCQVLEMPYINNEVSFIIVLPKKESLVFTPEELKIFLESSKNKTLIELSLPKFKFESNYLLKENLSKLGMENSFSPLAEFGGISEINRVRLDDVIHKTFIEVGEKGTEAAAVTAVVMVEDSCIEIHEEPKTIEFNANHPFLFAIRHNKTGVILFMGALNQL